MHFILKQFIVIKINNIIYTNVSLAIIDIFSVIALHNKKNHISYYFIYKPYKFKFFNLLYQSLIVKIWFKRQFI